MNVVRKILDLLHGLALMVVAVVGLLAVFVLGLSAYLDWHFESATTRKAIAAEAPSLLQGAGDFVPAQRLPKTIAWLKPESVYARPEGLYIGMRHVVAAETGYFVPRDGYAPKDHGELKYKPLGDGVWWYNDED